MPDTVQQAVNSAQVAAASAVKFGNDSNAASNDLGVSLMNIRDQLTSLTDWVNYIRANGAAGPIAGGGGTPPPPPPWPK